MPQQYAMQFVYIFEGNYMDIFKSLISIQFKVKNYTTMFQGTCLIFFLLIV